MDADTCDKCGKTVVVGEWPFCPHGFGNNLEDPLEQYEDWQLTDGEEHEAPLITTRAQRRAIMRAHGLEYHESSDAKMRGRIFIDLGRKTR